MNVVLEVFIYKVDCLKVVNQFNLNEGLMFLFCFVVVKIDVMIF